MESTTTVGRVAGIILPTMVDKKKKLPREFVWPRGELAGEERGELKEPLIDLGGFRRGEEEATAEAAAMVRMACMKHGVFQVTNHGVEEELIKAAYEEGEGIFKMPLVKKISVGKKPGRVSGYSGAHADRFSSKLPWKETFSFEYSNDDSQPLHVLHHFKSLFGCDFENTGSVFFNSLPPPRKYYDIQSFDFHFSVLLIYTICIYCVCLVFKIFV